MVEKYQVQISWFHLSRNKFDWKKTNTIQYYKQRKTQTIEQTKVFKEELIETAWHPDRFMKWCVDSMDLDEIDIIFGN